MNFKETKEWFEKERICPIRTSISSILASCSELTNSIPESKVKAEIFKSDAQQIIYSAIELEDATTTMSIIIGTCLAYDLKMSNELKDAFDYFTKIYHVKVELVALSFNNTYKIVFKTDTKSHLKMYFSTLTSELATAYPNAKICIDEKELTLSITDVIDF